MNIYHYTCFESMISILTCAINENKICFWASRYDSMNDPIDFIYARDIVIPQLSKCIKESDVNDASKEHMKCSPYIISFCKSGQDHEMQKSYNADVALVFDSKLIDKYIEDKHSMRLIECRYCDEKEIPFVFTEIFNNEFEQSNKPLSDAEELSVYFKRPKYEYENEIRLVSFAYDGFFAKFDDNSDGKCQIIYTETSDIDIKIRSGKDGIPILYQEIYLPLNALSGINIFTEDKNKFSNIKERINVILKNNGCFIENQINQINFSNTNFN